MSAGVILLAEESYFWYFDALIKFWRAAEHGATEAIELLTPADAVERMEYVRQSKLLLTIPVMPSLFNVLGLRFAVTT